MFKRRFVIRELRGDILVLKRDIIRYIGYDASIGPGGQLIRVNHVMK